MINFDISTFNKIFSLSGEKKYVELNNTVCQRWFIPLENHKLFLSLFQPSSIKGKIVVKTFNIIKHFPRILNLAHAKIVSLTFSDQFCEAIDDIFQQNGCEYGIFCGSPRKHQKMTLMVVNNGKILGYCKLSDKDYIRKLFEKERNSLVYLHEKGICNVPFSLYCDKLKFCNIYAFVQTTKRNGKITIANRFSPELFEFIQNFNAKTVLYIPFEDSDYAKSLERLVVNLKFLNDRELKECFKRGIDTIYYYRYKFNEFCAYHGDLTAWNSFIVKRQLFVFDLEYFNKSYPRLCDYFHFFTQDLLYNKNADTEEIYKQYQIIKSKFLNIENIDLLYLSYLLIVVDFYLNRDKAILNNRLYRCFHIWSELINKLLCDVKKYNQ